MPQPEVLRKLTAEAMVGRAHLGTGSRQDYLFVVHDFDWCGSAGCSLLIGEHQTKEGCRLVYSGHGDDEITISPGADHDTGAFTRNVRSVSTAGDTGKSTRIVRPSMCSIKRHLARVGQAPATARP